MNNFSERFFFCFFFLADCQIYSINFDFDLPPPSPPEPGRPQRFSSSPFEQSLKPSQTRSESIHCLFKH